MVETGFRVSEMLLISFLKREFWWVSELRGSRVLQTWCISECQGMSETHGERAGQFRVTSQGFGVHRV